MCWRREGGRRAGRPPCQSAAAASRHVGGRDARPTDDPCPPAHSAPGTRQPRAGARGGKGQGRVVHRRGRRRDTTRDRARRGRAGCPRQGAAGGWVWHARSRTGARGGAGACERAHGAVTARWGARGGTGEGYVPKSWQRLGARTACVGPGASIALLVLWCEPRRLAKVGHWHRGLLVTKVGYHCTLRSNLLKCRRGQIDT